MSQALIRRIPPSAKATPLKGSSASLLNTGSTKTQTTPTPSPNIVSTSPSTSSVPSTTTPVATTSVPPTRTITSSSISTKTVTSPESLTLTLVTTPSLGPLDQPHKTGPEKTAIGSGTQSTVASTLITNSTITSIVHSSSSPATHTSDPSPSSDPSSSSDSTIMTLSCKTPTGTLVGAVLGTFFAYSIVILLVAIFLVRRHKRKHHSPPVPPKDAFYPYRFLTVRPQLMAEIRSRVRNRRAQSDILNISRGAHRLSSDSTVLGHSVWTSSISEKEDGVDANARFVGTQWDSDAVEFDSRTMAHTRDTSDAFVIPAGAIGEITEPTRSSRGRFSLFSNPPSWQVSPISSRAMTLPGGTHARGPSAATNSDVLV